MCNGRHWSSKVSVIVCCKNASEYIEASLLSIRKNRPKELIVVDGHSDDDTVSICQKYADKILVDPGQGLAVARNIGLDHASGDLIYYVGPDNILPDGSIDELANFLMCSDYGGAAPLTAIADRSTYLGNGMHYYRMAKIIPGKSDVIGTPWMYRSEIMKRYRYDSAMRFSDDTDLCYRLAQNGVYVAYMDSYVYEQGTESLASVVTRWTIYGISDADFYKKYSGKWSWHRKISSWLHPLRTDCIGILGSDRIGWFEKVYILPLLIFFVFVRYRSWIRAGFS